MWCAKVRPGIGRLPLLHYWDVDVNNGERLRQSLDGEFKCLLRLNDKLEVDYAHEVGRNQASILPTTIGIVPS